MVRQQKNEELMAAGVTLIDPATTYVDSDVVVGADTVMHPCVILEGSTQIGAACEIHAGARIVNSTIGDRVWCETTRWSPTPRSNRARSWDHSRTSGRGPSVGEDAHIGNFVELKKTRVGQGGKGQPPGVSRRRDDRREGQRRRRHDYLQL